MPTLATTLKSLKVAELKVKLKEKGLDVTGVKAVLIQRLVDAEEDVEAAEPEAEKEEEPEAEQVEEKVEEEETKPEETFTTTEPEPVATKKRSREDPGPEERTSPAPQKPKKSEITGPVNSFGYKQTSENKPGARPTRPSSWKMPSQNDKLPAAADVPFPPLEPVELTLVKKEEIGNGKFSETVIINSRYVGRVLGRGGETVRDLQNRSGCGIDLDQGVTGDEKHITFKGTPSGILLGKYLTSLLSCEYGYELPLPLLSASQNSVEVSDFVVGTIIGPSGKMIKHLQNVTNTRIQVEPKGVDGGIRKVTFTGEKGQVEIAMQLVGLLAEGNNLPFEYQPGALPRGANMMPRGIGGLAPSMGGPPLPFPQAIPVMGYNGMPVARPPVLSMMGAETSKKFPISKSVVGRVIGRRGSTVVDLEMRTNTKITTDQNGPDAIMSVVGGGANVEAAVLMIQDIIMIGPNHPYVGGGSYNPNQQGGPPMGGGGFGGPPGGFGGPPGGGFGGPPGGFGGAGGPQGQQEGREVSVDRRQEVSEDRLEEDLGSRLEEAGDMVRAEEYSRRAGSTEMAVEEEVEGKGSMETVAEEAGADLLREE
ncbi:hypothetical protein TrLO_g156 [Triparma laevis f. longispina]|uniref:SAP domain-containing protein n=1 Tax=Triparma laevis f. longispina TaxID=1714387 RepID=A0A9W7DXZ2_9STRA|nr:hypothetical protein TrLO_g156 [Triparma laevis f. longispina]